MSAAAVRAHADLIVTYNRRHFPAASCEAWEIGVQGPSTFLRGLYDLDAGLFTGKLHEQAAAIGVSTTTLATNKGRNGDAEEAQSDFPAQVRLRGIEPPSWF